MKVKALKIIVLFILVVFPITLSATVDYCIECGILLNGECLADKYLPFGQTSTRNYAEWSAVRGVWYAKSNTIGVKFKFDDQAINTLSQNGLGFEIEIIEKNSHKLKWVQWSALLPEGSRPVQDTNASDWGSDTVYGILVRNTQHFEAGKDYYVSFIFESLPESGVLIQPNFVIDINSGCSLYEWICYDVPDQEPCQYFEMETDKFTQFTALPSGKNGVCWNSKSGSEICCPSYPDIGRTPSQNEEIDESNDINVFGPGYVTIFTELLSPGLPDFIVHKLWLETPWGVEAYKYGSPETMKMKAQFENIGDGSCSGDIEVHFYLSKGYKEDPHSGDGAWTRVGTDYIRCDNLDPGETQTETEGIELWRDIPAPGIWNIVACIDHTQDDHNNGGAFSEEHESNNCSTEAVFEVTSDGQVVNVPEYDFIVSSIQLANTPIPVPAGGLMGSKMAIRNIGNATSPSNIRSNYAINGTGTNGQWVQIADDESLASELFPGRDQWEEIISLVRAPTVPGTYTLRGCADYQSAVAETNETNNCSSIQFTVQPPMPDFIISVIGIAGGNTSFKAGTNLHPAMYVKNIGNAGSPRGIRSSYYYFGPQSGNVWRYVTDDGSDAGELCTGCQVREQYDSGIKVSTRGTYYFKGCADYQSVVAESNEGNNCTVSGPITIY